MDALRNLLAKTLQKHGLHAQAEAALLCHRATLWLAENAAPLSGSVTFAVFRDGVLEARCQTSVAAQALREQEAALLTALRESPPQGGLQGLRITRAD